MFTWINMIRKKYVIMSYVMVQINHRDLISLLFLAVRQLWTSSVWSSVAKWSVCALNLTPARLYRETLSSSLSLCRYCTSNSAGSKHFFTPHTCEVSVSLSHPLSTSRWRWSWLDRQRVWSRSEKSWNKEQVKLVPSPPMLREFEKMMSEPKSTNQ